MPPNLCQTTKIEQQLIAQYSHYDDKDDFQCLNEQLLSRNA